MLLLQLHTTSAIDDNANDVGCNGVVLLLTFTPEVELADAAELSEEKVGGDELGVNDSPVANNVEIPDVAEPMAGEIREASGCKG